MSTRSHVFQWSENGRISASALLSNATSGIFHYANGTPLDAVVLEVSPNNIHWTPTVQIRGGSGFQVALFPMRYVRVRREASTTGDLGSGTCSLTYIDTEGETVADPVMGPLALYVSTQGDDSNDGVTSDKALKTLQAAVDKLKFPILSPTSITMGAGVFSSGAALSNVSFGRNADGSQGSLTITGTLIDASIGSGPVNGTLSAVVQGANTAWGLLTDGSANWTNNSLRRRFIEITSGPAMGRVFPIYDNTTNSITVAGAISLVLPTTGSTYRLRECGTVIDGVTPSALDPIQLETGVQPTTAAASFHIDGTHQGYGGSARLIIQRLRFNNGATRAMNVYTDASLLVRQCQWNQTASGTRGVVLNNQGTVRVRDCSVLMSATGTLIEQQSGGNARLVDMQRNIVDGTGNTVAVGTVGYLNARDNAIANAVRCYHFGTILDGVLAYDRYTACGVPLQGDFASGDATTGQLAIRDVSFGTNSGAISMFGPMNLIFQDSVGSTSQSTGYAIFASEGCRVRLVASTNVTGSVKDLLADSADTALNLVEFRALNGKVLQGFLGSFIWQR